MIFTSQSGVKFVAGNHRFNIEEIEQTVICAIGPKTAQALENNGIKVDLIPEQFSSSGLVETLAPLVYGRKVEVVRSSKGSRVLPKGLNQAGGFVHQTIVYEIKCPKAGKGQAKRILEEGDIFLFTSSQIVKNFFKTFSHDEKTKDTLNGKLVGAIGRPTLDKLRSYGVEVKIIPHKATFKSLVKEAKRFINQA
jgi:uroporphyrinogen-III synthase